MAYGCTITVQTAKIPSSQSNFVWLATESNFPTAAIDGGATSILNGGGNLRCYTDSSKTTQLPIEVVTFVTGGTPSVQVRGLSPSLAVGGTVYIEADTVATTQPAVTDTYGRNAVWSGSDRVYHFEEDPSINDPVDSSGNVDATRVGTFTSGDRVSGKIGNALSFFTSTANYLISGTITAANQSKTISSWVLYKSLTSQRGIWSIASTPTDSGPSVLMSLRGGVVDMLDTGSYRNVQAAPLVDVFYKVDYVYDSATSTTRVYVNGIESVSYPSGAGVFATGDNIYINNGYSSPSETTVSDFTVSPSAKNANYIAAEYNNQNDPATFWATSAWVQSGGGGAITVTGATPNFPLSAISASIDLTGEIAVTGNTPNYSYAPIIGAVDLTGEITVTGQTVNYSLSAESGSIDLTGIISVSGQTPNYTLDTVNGSVGLTGELTVTGSTPSYSISSVNGSVTLDALISVVGQTPSYVYAADNGAIDLTGEITVIGSTPNYLLAAIGGIVAIGDSQIIGTVTAGFKDSGVSVKYKQDDITTTFKANGITVKFKE